MPTLTPAQEDHSPASGMRHGDAILAGLVAGWVELGALTIFRPRAAAAIVAGWLVYGVLTG